jgi:hypothetical protein
MSYRPLPDWAYIVGDVCIGIICIGILLFVMMMLSSLSVSAQEKPQAPPAPTQEQITQANERMAMLRQQRDENADQIALLRIELQRAAEKATACKAPEPTNK